MDAEGRIYKARSEEDVPLVDRARLDGYLRGRADADELDEIEEMRKQFASLREELERRDG